MIGGSIIGPRGTAGIVPTETPKCDFKQAFRCDFDLGLFGTAAQTRLMSLTVPEQFYWRRLYFGRFFSGYQAFYNHLVYLRASLAGTVVCEWPIYMSNNGTYGAMVEAAEVPEASFEFPQLVTCTEAAAPTLSGGAQVSPIGAPANSLTFSKIVSHTGTENRIVSVCASPVEICAKIDRLELFLGYWSNAAVEEQYATAFFGLGCYSQNLPF